MTNKNLSTDSYKGVRDFYPKDMAIQRYIFDTWSQTAESFGFECYDASILEPSDIYKAKGVENEEMVNEQTYTFTDRGNREVTLRPEMTPTVARMIAGKKRELSFPVRWYSIPNLFRYERPQRGRLREHWQLNCDIFGANDYTADVEIILLANQLITDFGATSNQFEIRINDRAEMRAKYAAFGVTEIDIQDAITRLNDRFYKITTNEYHAALLELVKDVAVVNSIHTLIAGDDTDDSNKVVASLRDIGITNVKIDRSIARGFNYYTGTIFEIYDVSDKNNRAMLGGGRYDNLTEMFGGEAIAGIGFGMGDVTMRDFLETHNLLITSTTTPTLMVIPMNNAQNMAAQKIAMQFRSAHISTATDIGTKKIGKKIGDASDRLVDYVLVVGEDELVSERYTLKNMLSGEETIDTIQSLIYHIHP